MQEITKKIQKAERKLFTAQQKCEAVLSVWTERRKPAEVCKDLTIKWALLSHWQNRALEGMLQALQPRVSLERGPALSPRLQTLLEKRMGKVSLESNHNRLAQRLENIQKTARPHPSEAKKKRP